MLLSFVDHLFNAFYTKKHTQANLYVFYSCIRNSVNQVIDSLVTGQSMIDFFP